ncbi:MAG: ABC transporter permease [Candidatus Bathyarchaeum sp.]|nr:MAG: ABC transporter permease [Candidatus Bathyarchaeum sp.]
MGEVDFLIPFTYAVKEIRRRKYRTAVNIAGFIIAISTLITLVMAARGWETCTKVPLNSIGTDIILFYTAPVKPAGTGCYIVNHLFSYPFNQTLLTEIEDVPDVECAVPILMHRLRAMVFTGIDPSETETNAVLPSSIIEGRYLTAHDGYVALVDNEYAQLNNLTLGSTVTYAADFEVVGIVEVSATNIMKSHIYVNLPIVQEVLPEKPVGLVNMGLIRTSSPGKVEKTATALEDEWPNSSTLTGSDLAETAFGVIQINEDTAWSISIALAVITILFTIKSQLSTVAERTKEIGILKAIGWSNSNVVNQIAIESVIQGIIGGLLGCALGYIFASYVLSTIGGEIGGALNFITIDPIILSIGFGISMVSGIVAGLFSSWRAARLVPVDALRTI